LLKVALNTIKANQTNQIQRWYIYIAISILIRIQYYNCASLESRP
jgi:hypothetical protein